MAKNGQKKRLYRHWGGFLLLSVALIAHPTFLCICTITKIGNDTEEIARIGEEVNMKPILFIYQSRDICMK